MLLKDVCTANVVCCSAQTTAVQAASLMRHHHVGDLVVVDAPNDEGVPLGVVTDRDLAIDVLGKGLDPVKTTVGSLMRKPVVVAHEAEDTGQVIERMRTHGVRRLPVVGHEGEVVGIITLDDLLRLCVTDAKSLLDIMAKGKSNEEHSRR